MKFARILYDDEIYYAKYDNSSDMFELIEGDIFDFFSYTSTNVNRNEVKILPPCEPSKIVAVGLNYANHANEMGLNIPKFPALFLKPSSSVIGNMDNIIYPDMSEQVDYEAELAIVIGETASHVSESEAKKYILGYTCLNDITARDLQRLDSQWTRAKGFDTFAPIGPFIETELDPDNADIRLRLNGKVMQESNTSNFIFKTDYLVSAISQIMTLYPGDIITTGTPSGIGSMNIGDTVEVEIDGIGTLTNFVKERQK